MRQAQLFAGFTTPVDVTTDGVAMLTAQRERSAVRTVKLSEREVTKVIVDWLHTRGWTSHRKHVGTFVASEIASNVIGKLHKGLQAGTLSNMDFIYAYDELQRAKFTLGREGLPDWVFTHPHYPAFFLEMKATGEKPRDKQEAVLAQLRREGYPATWSDSFVKFERWYLESIAPLAY